jgi:hypothetical protein
MAMNIKNKYEIGDPVYLVTDGEQVIGQVIGIIVTPIGIMYNVRFDCEVMEVYDIEITSEPNQLTKLGIKEAKTK